VWELRQRPQQLAGDDFRLERAIDCPLEEVDGAAVFWCKS